ncbi:MAG: hypothetical protein WA765_14730, partial [Candidatus Acidiferrum sp.]
LDIQLVPRMSTEPVLILKNLLKPMGRRSALFVSIVSKRRKQKSPFQKAKKPALKLALRNW